MANKQRKVITSGLVHVTRDNGDVVTLRPGDEVPEWAENIVTNPALFEKVAVEPTPQDPSTTGEPQSGESKEPATEPVKEPTIVELRAIAKELGISAGGSKADLAARIAAKQAETVSAPAGDENVSEDRAALIAKLTERGIEFEDDNTDDELALILENAE